MPLTTSTILALSWWVQSKSGAGGKFLLGHWHILDVYVGNKNVPHYRFGHVKALWHFTVQLLETSRRSDTTALLLRMLLLHRNCNCIRTAAKCRVCCTWALCSIVKALTFLRCSKLLLLLLPPLLQVLLLILVLMLLRLPLPRFALLQLVACLIYETLNPLIFFFPARNSGSGPCSFRRG